MSLGNFLESVSQTILVLVGIVLVGRSGARPVRERRLGIPEGLTRAGVPVHERRIWIPEGLTRADAQLQGVEFQAHGESP